MPPNIAGKWARALVYLGVTVVVVAAPILGVVAIPKFTSLLSAFPEEIRTLLTAVISLLVGVVAVFVRMFAESRIAVRTQRILGAGCLAGVVVFAVAIGAHLTFWVADVEYDGGEHVEQFIIGGGEKLGTCTCPSSVSDAECIQGLSFDPAKVSSCWGDRSIRKAKFWLMIDYIVTLFLFALAVAFLVMAEGQRRNSKSRA